MMKYEWIRHDDKLFIVERKWPADRIRLDKIQDLREALECDIVLKNNDWLFYCKRIEEAEIIE